MTEQCSYELNPKTTDIELQFSAAELNDEGRWSCPHEADGEFCIFHKPTGAKSSKEVQRELLKKLRTADNTDRTQLPQFVGIQVTQLDFSSQILSSIGVPIDLRNGDIGSLSVKRSIVNDDLNLRGCTINDSLIADRATFEGDVNLVGVEAASISGEGAQFKARLLIESITTNTLSFERATFEGIITGSSLEVSGETNFVDADFHDITVFERSSFQTGLHAQNATFRRRVDFTETLFGGQTNFSKVTFEGQLFLSMALFEQGVVFDNVTFEEQFTLRMVTLRDTASFDGATFSEGAQMQETAFRHDMSFKQATFDESISFANSNFHRSVDFRNATMQEGADFTQVRFGGDTDFENTTFLGPVEFVPANDCQLPTGRINLRKTTIQKGTLAIPDDEAIVYDLEEATIGKATLGVGDTSQPLAYYRLVNVTYDGFDFAKGIHRNAFEASHWNLHRTHRGDGDSTTSHFIGNLPRRFGVFMKEASILEPHDIESTYLKAKNGANEIGDSIAASEFFQREKLFRRLKHRQAAGDSKLSHLNRAKSVFNWGTNFVFSLISGYGEKPFRVVFTSLFSIGVFALIYNFLIDGPFEDAGFGDNLLFSFQSFITFILGTPPAAADFEIQLLSSIQGFLGAFLIALFVFTLTRSVDR